MRFVLLAALAFAMTAPPKAPEGARIVASQHDVAATIDRLAALIESHGGKVFARIDFAADAAKVGLVLRPEVLLVFGNPKAGTALLQASPTAGLDLPLKALAWTDDAGATWIAFDTADYVTSRHAIPASLKKNIEGALSLIEQAAR